MKPDRPCSVCQQRMDAVASAIGRHPGCGAYEPVTDDALGRLIANLATSLGAVEIESTSNSGDTTNGE